MQDKRGACGTKGRGDVRRAGAAALGILLTAALAADSALAWPAARERNATTAVEAIAVFGSDDRTPLPPKYKDVREKIGLLFNTRRPTVCTAFCVAKDVIATASHCLHGTASDQDARLGDFIFARNFDAARDFTRIAGHDNGTAALNVIAGAAKLSVRPPIDAARDWALVRLSRPACSKGVLPLRSMPLEQVLTEAAAQRVFQIAYHRDYTPWKLSYSRPCDVAKSFETADWPQITQDFAEAQQLILHTCDTGGASSGSPILLDTEAGPEVIGINVGTYVQSKVLMRQGKVKERLKADTVANTGVASAAFASRLETFERSNIVSSKAEMRELQALLKQRALYAGRLDGTYGATVKAAIEAYEKAEGLQVTGLATSEILRRLASSTSTERPKDAPRGRLRRTKS
jgi:protease YdgD